MPYLNLDDNHADDRTVWRLSDAAFRLDVAAMLYCSRLSTDGLIDRDQLPRLVPRFRPALVDELVAAGWWHPLELDPDTFYLPQTMRHNRTRDRIEEDRAATRERQAAHRARVRREREQARHAEKVTRESHEGVTRDNP